MTEETGYATDLIDVSDLSLADLEGLPDTALAAALREVMAETAAPVSAGFSSRLGQRGKRASDTPPL